MPSDYKISISFWELEALLDPSMSHQPATAGFLISQLICSKFNKVGLNIEKPSTGRLMFVQPQLNAANEFEVYWIPTDQIDAVDLDDKKVLKIIVQYVKELTENRTAVDNGRRIIQST